jgi:hypothetical protein
MINFAKRTQFSRSVSQYTVTRECAGGNAASNRPERSVSKISLRLGASKRLVPSVRPRLEASIVAGEPIAYRRLSCSNCATES